MSDKLNTHRLIINIHVKMRKRKEVGIQALFRENASYLKKNEIEFQ